MKEGRRTRLEKRLGLLLTEKGEKTNKKKKGTPRLEEKFLFYAEGGRPKRGGKKKRTTNFGDRPELLVRAGLGERGGRGKGLRLGHGEGGEKLFALVYQ